LRIVHYMDIKTLLKAFGSASEIARRFGVSRQAVAKWIKADTVPPLRAYQAREMLEKLGK
jgi:DNA invertase Pin-like site-specific DNA recombinase